MCGASIHEKGTALRREDTSVLHPLVISGSVLCHEPPGEKVKCGKPADGHLFDFRTVHLLLTQNLGEMAAQI